MRKLILLVLALSLCFMIGCKEEKEPIKEIENIEVQEFEEPITEPKIEEPIEETPVEPEAEEPIAEKPEEAEPVEELDENVIILPQPDENTVMLEVEIPQEFIEKEYDICQVPELVKNEDFEWGEYALFGRSAYAGIVNATLMTHAPCYYILSSDAKTLHEGEVLYKEFNDQYLLEYTGTKTASNYESDLPEEYLDYLYKSRIVYISPSLDILERFYFLAEDSHWRHGAWDTLYSLIENGNVTEEKILKNIHIGDFYAIESLYKKYDNFTKYQHPDSNYKYDNDYNIKSLVFCKNEANFYENHLIPWTHFNVKGNITYTNDSTFGVYSKDNNKINYIVKINNDTIISLSDSEEERYYTNIIWHDGNRQLISFEKTKYSQEHFDVAYTQSLYLLELDSGKLTYLEDYVYSPHLSPDGKYLAYSSPNGAVTDAKNDPVDIMPKGVYIKNLEKDATTFLKDYKDNFRNHTISWINRKKLINKIAK